MEYGVIGMSRSKLSRGTVWSRTAVWVSVFVRQVDSKPQRSIPTQATHRLMILGPAHTQHVWRLARWADGVHEAYGAYLLTCPGACPSGLPGLDT